MRINTDIVIVSFHMQLEHLSTRIAWKRMPHIEPMLSKLIKAQLTTHYSPEVPSLHFESQSPLGQAWRKIMYLRDCAYHTSRWIDSIRFEAGIYRHGQCSTFNTSWFVLTGLQFCRGRVNLYSKAEQWYYSKYNLAYLCLLTKSKTLVISFSVKARRGLDIEAATCIQ